MRNLTLKWVSLGPSKRRRGATIIDNDMKASPAFTAEWRGSRRHQEQRQHTLARHLA